MKNTAKPNQIITAILPHNYHEMFKLYKDVQIMHSPLLSLTHVSWRWPSITSSTPARTSLVAAPASGRCSSKLVSLVGISSNMLRADTRSPALTQRQRNGTHRSVAGMRAEKRDLGHHRRCVRSSFLASGWEHRAWRRRCTRVRARRWWTTSSPAEHAGGGGPAALAFVIAGGGGPARAHGDGAPRRQSTPATVHGHTRR